MKTDELLKNWLLTDGLMRIQILRANPDTHIPNGFALAALRILAAAGALTHAVPNYLGVEASKVSTSELVVLIDAELRDLDPDYDPRKDN